MSAGQVCAVEWTASLGAIRVQVSASPRSSWESAIGCRAGAHFGLDGIAGYRRGGAIREAPEAHEVDAGGGSILAGQAGQASDRTHGLPGLRAAHV